MKELKEMIEIGKKTNKLLERSNKIITITNIINAITILALIIVLVKK